MLLVSMRQLLGGAALGGYGVGALDVNMEQIQAGRAEHASDDGPLSLEEMREASSAGRQPG